MTATIDRVLTGTTHASWLVIAVIGAYPFVADSALPATTRAVGVTVVLGIVALGILLPEEEER